MPAGVLASYPSGWANSIATCCSLKAFSIKSRTWTFA